MITRERRRATLLVTGVVVLTLVLIYWLGSVIIHSITRHHAQEGTVIALDYNPTQVVVNPGYTTCDAKGNCTFHPGYTTVIPENWNLRVEDSTDTQDWHEIDRYVFEGCRVGNYWPGEDGECRER